MAIAVTYTFSNGTTSSATEVNTNFQDIIDGVTDGTEAISVGQLTVAGATALNGNTTIGNASSDDLTITASLASNIVIKTANTYGIGAAGTGLTGIYYQSSASNTTRLIFGSGVANVTWTLPGIAGVKGRGLVLTDSAGTFGFKPMQSDINTVSSAGYDILDDDGYSTILVSTSTSARTVTLPTAADNTNRVITIKRTDAFAAGGYILLEGEGAETIDGLTNLRLYMQNEFITVKCDGTGWHSIARGFGKPASYTPDSGTNQGVGTLTNMDAIFSRHGEMMHINLRFTLGTVAASEARIALPSGHTGSYSSEKFIGRWARSSTSATTVKGGNVIGVNSANYVAFGLDDYTNTENSFTKQNGNVVFTNSQDVSFHAMVRIAEWISA